MNHGASAEQGEEEAAEMPPEASAGVPKGAYRMYVHGGIQVPSGQELANPSSAQDLCASPMKEKRCRRFSTSDFFVNYIFKFLDTLIAIKKYSGLEGRSERRAGVRKSS